MVETAADVKIEEITPVKFKLTFGIPWSVVKKELDSAYNQVGKTAKIKGFRPGKTPRKVLELHYRDSAESDAISNLVNKFYDDAIRENKLLVVDQPKIDQNGIEIDKNFTFSASVEVQPIVEPKDYFGLELEKEELAITENDLQARFEQIRDMYSSIEPILEEREIKEADFAVIDFEGKVTDGTAKDLKADDYLLQIGSKTFIPGFEDHLVGMKKNESKEFNITFPEDYDSKDIAGKEVVFSVTLKDIKEKKLPELDDTFIQNFDKYNSLEELKEDIKKSLEDEEKDRIKMNFRNNIVGKLLENNPFEVPSVFVEKQIYILSIDAQQRMMAQGLSPDRATQLIAGYQDQFRDQATKMVKTYLLFNKIAEKEGISVEEQDVDEKIKSLAEKYGQDFAPLKEKFENEKRSGQLKDEVLEDKVFDFIEEKGKVSFVEKNKEEKQEKSE